MKHDATSIKKRTKDQFDAWAQTYDGSLLNYFLFRPSYYVFLEELAKWQQQNERLFDILDIGCGTGTLLGMIAASNLRVGHIVGMDYAMNMCQLARGKTCTGENGARIQCINGDSEHLPFADETFDIITCSNSLHHYPHQQQVVLEMRRLIRSGGRLIIIDGFRDNAVGWVVYDVIITRIEKSVFHPPWTTMRNYFEKAGFGDIYHRKFNFLFPAYATVGSV